jgi:hypothetical protein
LRPVLRSVALEAATARAEAEGPFYDFQDRSLGFDPAHRVTLHSTHATRK